MKYLIWLIPIGVFLWLMWDRIPKKIPGGITGGLKAPKIPDWLIVTVMLCACHATAWYFWPELWRILAKSRTFWLNQVVVLLALFFQRVDAKGKKAFLPGVSWLLTILLIGNVWTAWGWGESYYTQARQRAMAEYQQAIAAEQAVRDALPRSFTVEAPPEGAWSSRVPTLHGESWRTEGPIYVRVDSGQVTEDGPGENHPIFRTNWVQFRSRTSQTVKVTVYR